MIWLAAKLALLSGGFFLALVTQYHIDEKAASGDIHVFAVMSVTFLLIGGFL